jgi:hypothetical protein
MRLDVQLLDRPATRAFTYLGNLAVVGRAG